jgi:signal transduction histidine kinase
LVARDEVVGLATCGVPIEYLPRTRNRLRVLGLFARQAAATLTAGRVEAKLAEPQVAGAENRLAARKMAHEVNNPLAIMKNYVGLLRMKLNEGHPAQDDLRVISDEIDRVARMIRDYAHGNGSGETTPAPVPEPPNESHVEVAALIADLLRLVTPTLLAPRNISAVSRIDASLPLLDLHADTLKQALLNLVKNAAEAMEQGGTLTLGARPITLDGDAWVEMTVSDTGPGLPKELQTRVFRPVASTKGGDHQGLGLSIVKSLVTRLHGIVAVETTTAGTRFRILLPARAP